MAEGPETQPETSSSSQPSSRVLSQVPIFDGLFPPQPDQDQDQANRGPGLYAVRVLPSLQAGTGFQTNTLLIPFNYNIPMAHSSSGIGELNGEQGPPQQEAGPQRLVRRFQIDIQLDLLLILKLAAVVFLFHDGSKLRLTLLVVLASLIYLHQTGALAPAMRWFSQRAANLPAAAEPQENENIGLLAADAQAVGVNENEQAVEQPGQGEARNRLWGIVKEIKIFVFGFITSLLPAFNNVD